MHDFPFTTRRNTVGHFVESNILPHKMTTVLVRVVKIQTGNIE